MEKRIVVKDILEGLLKTMKREEVLEQSKITGGYVGGKYAMSIVTDLNGLTHKEALSKLNLMFLEAAAELHVPSDTIKLIKTRTGYNTSFYATRMETDDEFRIRAIMTAERKADEIRRKRDEYKRSKGYKLAKINKLKKEIEELENS